MNLEEQPKSGFLGRGGGRGSAVAAVEEELIAKGMLVRVLNETGVVGMVEVQKSVSNGRGVGVVIKKVI